MIHRSSSSKGGAHLSRRNFLKNAGLALAAGFALPSIVPARALGRDGEVAPSNRITMGVVGTIQGWSDLQSFLPFKDVQAVAICDVDAKRREQCANDLDRHYKTKGTQKYNDFREMFAKANLDTVIIAPPDHWHAIIAIAAARAGIDIYGEKPLAHTLAEGRAIVNAVQQHGRVWQTGSWQRSTQNFFRAVELVRNGAIGKVMLAKVGTLAKENGFDHSLRQAPNPAAIGKPPSNIDYDMWVGPAQWMEYDPRFVGYHWRWVLNFGGGNLMDWVGHHVDIAHWGLGLDETGPVKITGSGVYCTKAPFDAEEKYQYDCTYANGMVISVSSGNAPGVRFIGEDEQFIHVDRGQLKARPSAALNAELNADVPPVYKSGNHSRNFIDCVKTRQLTITPVETAHRSASVGHLGHIAVHTGRTINWDPVTETIKDDPGASQLLTRQYRAPWVL